MNSATPGPSPGGAPRPRSPSAWADAQRPLLLLLPTTTQRRDQLHTGGQTTAQQAEVGALVVQRRGLHIDHAVEVHGAGLVLVLDQAQGLAGCVQRLLLDYRFLLQHTQLHQVIFHLTEAVEYRLTVLRHSLVVGRFTAFQLGATRATIEQ